MCPTKDSLQSTLKSKPQEHRFFGFVLNAVLHFKQPIMKGVSQSGQALGARLIKSIRSVLKHFGHITHRGIFSKSKEGTKSSLSIINTIFQLHHNNSNTKGGK